MFSEGSGQPAAAEEGEQKAVWNSVKRKIADRSSLDISRRHGHHPLPHVDRENSEFVKRIV